MEIEYKFVDETKKRVSITNKENDTKLIGQIKANQN